VVERAHDLELLSQSVGTEPVGDLEPRRVVGEREVVVAEVACLGGHRLDGVAAVGPVRVRVQVTFQPRAQRFAVIGTRLREIVEQLGEVLRRLTVERLDDDPGRLLAYSGDVGEPAALGKAAQLVVGNARHLARGLAESLLPVRRRAAAHQQLRNPLERLDRGHANDGTLNTRWPTTRDRTGRKTPAGASTGGRWSRSCSCATSADLTATR